MKNSNIRRSSKPADTDVKSKRLAKLALKNEAPKDLSAKDVMNHEGGSFGYHAHSTWKTMGCALVLALLATVAAAPSAGAQSRAREGATESWLILGKPTAALCRIPGVEGRFGLNPFVSCTLEAGSSISARLRALRDDPALVPLGALHYQIFSRDSRSTALWLSDVMRLPVGTDEEATVAIAVHGATNALASEISYPAVAMIEITLSSEPIHSLWTRHLSFTDHTGVAKLVAIDFARKSGLTWSGTVDAANLATLESLANTGNRSHWDHMKLENRGGTTTLDIARFRVVLHYDKSSSYEEDIPIVDMNHKRTLASGTSSIDLEAYAYVTRKLWAGINGTMHTAVQLAAGDFGKSGSDGTDSYGSNPKFGNADELLCSEFVSWYYYQVGLVIGGEDFRDIFGTSQIDAAFTTAGRRYDYHNGEQAFINYGGTARYTPQAGDFLCRRYGGAYEHSMMVLKWNDLTKTMTVINGPWPVTLRYVEIQDLEESGYDFRVGKIQ